MTRVKWLLLLIAVAAVAGGVASVYAAMAKFGAASHEFCSINETFSCDLVNTSRYSEILGIPVSIMGLVAYVFFFFAAAVYSKQPNDRLLNLMIFGSVAGLLFSLYLTGIEAFVLHAWCILCIISQISIILITIGVFGIRYAENHKKITTEELHQ